MTAENVPIEESHEFVRDLNVGYCKYGNGPVNFLFIPGGVGCYKKDYPENVLRAFDPSFATIVAIDPPGYGTSRPPDRVQEVNRCKMDADYCVDLMKKLNLTPFVVLGWSEGGRTAVHVGAIGKELVSHMILLATSTKVDFRGDMAFKGMRNTKQWLQKSREPYLEHYSEEFFSKQWADLCDVVSTVYRDLGGRFPSDLVLPQLKMPVLLINGGNDRFIMDPKFIMEKVPQAKLEIHATGSHDLHITHPRWFALKITAFIKSNPTGKK
uniref:AB hydrolase-1 domain-containing protein n=1 Tax=Panagrolaimus sp. JU765 TaxID=591449 RepID=A0AC34QBS9_9BILA